MSIVGELGASKREFNIELNGATEFLVSESFFSKFKKPFVKINKWLDTHIFYDDEKIVIEGFREETIPISLFDRFVNWVDRVVFYDSVESYKEGILNIDAKDVSKDEVVKKENLEISIPKGEEIIMTMEPGELLDDTLSRYGFERKKACEEVEEAAIEFTTKGKNISVELNPYSFVQIVISHPEKTFEFYHDGKMIEIGWDKEAIDNYISQNIDLLKKSDIIVEIISKDNLESFSSNAEELYKLVDRVFIEEKSEVEEKENMVVNKEQMHDNQEQLYNYIFSKEELIDEGDHKKEIEELSSKQILLFDKYKSVKDYDEKESCKMQLYQIGQQLRDLKRFVELEKVVVRDEKNIPLKIEELKKQRAVLVFASKNKYENITKILVLEDQLDDLKLQWEKTELIEKIGRKKT